MTSSRRMACLHWTAPRLRRGCPKESFLLHGLSGQTRAANSCSDTSGGLQASPGRAFETQELLIGLLMPTNGLESLSTPEHVRGLRVLRCQSSYGP
eukprot:9179485-Alexandrium_andersonii.AAC.1